MVDGIVPFRPRREQHEPQSRDQRMEELEHLEELLELMHEHGVETRYDLERRIDELEAALEADEHGPKE
jgi:predicted nuclease with TOPRIM domain